MSEQTNKNERFLHLNDDASAAAMERIMAHLDTDSRPQAIRWALKKAAKNLPKLDGEEASE